MSAFEHDLTLRLGEPFTATITITEDGTPTGTPVDISAASLTFTVYPIDGDADLITKALSPTGQPGDAALSLTSGQVAALTAEEVYGYRVADATGRSLARGWVYVGPFRGAV
jgi:hypothetical protein